MKLTKLEQDIMDKLDKTLFIKGTQKQGRPKKEIIDYILFDELEINNYLKFHKIDNKEYYIDNEKRLYDIITEEYIGKL